MQDDNSFEDTLNNNFAHFKINDVLPHMMRYSKIKSHILSTDESFTVYLFYFSFRHLTLDEVSKLLSIPKTTFRQGFNLWMNKILGASQEWPETDTYIQQIGNELNKSFKFIEDARRLTFVLQPEAEELRSQTEFLTRSQTLDILLAKDRTNEINIALLKGGLDRKEFIKQARKFVSYRKTLEANETPATLKAKKNLKDKRLAAIDQATRTGPMRAARETKQLVKEARLEVQAARRTVRPDQTPLEALEVLATQANLEALKATQRALEAQVTLEIRRGREAAREIKKANKLLFIAFHEQHRNKPSTSRPRKHHLDSDRENGAPKSSRNARQPQITTISDDDDIYSSDDDHNSSPSDLRPSL